MKLMLLAGIFFASSVRCDDYEQTFSHIYESAYWGKNQGGEGTSGPGSLPENCVEYVAFIQQFMREHNITSVVDAGCGDWQFSRLIDWSGINYIGYDVVHSLIAQNNAMFANEHINFVHANFLTADVPCADLLLCKDVFQHLTNQDIINFKPKLKNFRYCLITNHVDSQSLSSDNPDITLGDFRRLDLNKAPFNISGTVVLNYRFGYEVHQVYLIDNSF